MLLTGPIDESGQWINESMNERRQIKSLLLTKQRLPQIAQLRNSPAHVIEPEVVDAHSLFNFFPAHRRRHTRFRCGAHGVNRCQGPAPRVLIVIDQHASRSEEHTSELQSRL